MAKAMPRGVKEPVEDEVFGETDDTDIDGMIWNIHGHAQAGKTFSSLAASQLWPEDLEKHKADGKTTFLEDIIHVGWDKTGPVGILPYKMKLRRRVSMRNLIFKKGDLLDAMKSMLDSLHDLAAKEAGNLIVIHDTITRMDSMIETYCFNKKRVVRTRDGEEDGQRTYGKVANIHHEYQFASTTLPSTITNIFLFHQKTLEERIGGSPAQKELKKRKDLVIKMGDEFIRTVPAVTGKTAAVYLADCSMEFVCKKKGKRGEEKRWLYSTVVDEERAKNRLEGVFDTREPAHMGKIIAKAKAACR